MGIKDLTQFLKKVDPELFVQVPLGKFAGHNLAVDASIFLYKFMCVTAQFSGGNWMDMFIAMVQWIRKWDINPIFVFDGAPPEEKSATQQERRERKAQIEEKTATIADVLKAVSAEPLNGALSSELQSQVNELLKIETELMPRKQVIFDLEVLHKKISSQSVRISTAEVKKLQAILTAAGLRCLNAVGEAERACAWLSHAGIVSGVITNDSDILVYGETVFIQDIKPNKTDCTVIRHCDILQSLDFTGEQFRDFCIMCGMDYNSRIHKIGPAKAYELLKKHQSIERICEENNLDPAPLLHQRVRELIEIQGETGESLFKEHPFNVNPPIPKRKELELLLLKSGSRYTAEQLVNYKARFWIEQ